MAAPQPMTLASAAHAHPVPAPLVRRCVVVFTDVVASTELMEQLGDLLARELLRHHEDLVRILLERHRGIEVQHTGDGFLLVFAGECDALRFAVALQRSLVDPEEALPGSVVRVRIGVHAGDAILEPGRLFGSTVNAAARICNRAGGGEILLSQAVHDGIGGESFVLEAFEEAALKGFARRFPLFRLDWDAHGDAGPRRGEPARLGARRA
jgi:class 3 adenylate cyclase